MAYWIGATFGTRLGEASYSWQIPYRDYDQVLEAYASWLVKSYGSMAPDVRVVDIHRALAEHVERGRQQSPAYRLSVDVSLA